MELLKLAIEWCKAEVFSSKFFILAGMMFLSATVAFWQLGKTEVARAYIYPTLITGSLLLIIGLGLLYANHTRISSFTTAYNSDQSAFMKSELERAEKTIKEYDTIVLKVIPIIIVVAALLIVFIDKPSWRAASITTIAMMVVILLVDSNAKARIEAYKEQLELVNKKAH